MKLKYLFFVFLLVLAFSCGCDSSERTQDDLSEGNTVADPAEDNSESSDQITVENVETNEIHYENVEVTEDVQEKNEEPEMNTETPDYDLLSMFQTVSAEDAMVLTGGKLMPYPVMNIDENNCAYLTPSGMLVYMSEWLYNRLPEGTNDFTVDMMSYQEGGNIGVWATDSRYDGEYLIDIEAEVVELYGVKCTVYVTQNDIGDLICYGVPTEGQVVYKYGFTVDSEEYSNHTLKISVYGGDGNVTEYSGPANSVVEAGVRTRYMGANPVFPEWNVKAEICDGDGNVVYTEEFRVYEGREFNSVMLQVLPLK